MNENFKRLFKKYSSPYKGMFAGSIGLSVLSVVLGMLPYLAAVKMTVYLISGQKSMQYLSFWCAAAALGYILKVIFSGWSTSISHKATFTTIRDIRKQLVAKLSRMPMGNILDTPSGQFKDTIVDRAESLETPLAHLLPEMTANILVPLLILAYLFVLDWRMALLSLVTIPVAMVFMMGAMKTYPEKYKESVKTNRDMTNAIVEYVNGIEVIKAFSQSASSYKKYSDAVVRNASYFYQWMKSCQWYMASYNTICPAVLISVLPIGFLFFLNSSLPAADFITVIILSLGVVGPIIAATGYVDQLAGVGTIANEICGILDAPELIRPDKEVLIKDLNIRLERVCFSYREDSPEKALNGVSLSITPGTVTALVGPSGSGKSTIAKLIAGFWDVSEGRITLGGRDIREIPQWQLADKIAYVAQDNYLFDDTIRENIRMGKKAAADREVEEAAKAAGCDIFIRKLENGYDTRVGDAGGRLSGGERQRIAIARAMLKNAPVVILDEATAYIDPENEAVIQSAVARLVKGKTLLVIAHRLSTITDSDQIVVVKDGVIASTGKHSELLNKSGLYREMWEAHIGAKDGDLKC
ncbi:ATP-binding cassette subfamily B protein [Ruminiclostridium sufflavum DSM 19573]|uniref:ATP-binding cassette subfamily B protein n=1 Tax=Ruminiclostridium sufflavum DSM 19573 TaxID=1121337 RepID=A0A318XQ94_9FIRM|nr:ABC transporter ATP-binding protein [Ruminiclostridium sufflavum]PYG90245.1 ATP-binding cassette subfamily B protein [Ruminiclostridium sufflavum DSM 19573]